MVAVAAAGSAIATELEKSGLSQVSQCEAIGLSACPMPFDAVVPSAVDMLTWDQGTRIIGFRNTYRLYKGDVFRTLGRKAYTLLPASYNLPLLRYRMDGHAYRIADYVRRQSVVGLLILKDDRIVYEYYGGGNGDQTLWTSRSVAKSVVSILIGIAVKEGLIHSVADPITRYLPELKGTAWEGVTLRNLLQ